MTMGLPGKGGGERKEIYARERHLSELPCACCSVKDDLYSGKRHIARRTLRRAAVLLPTENVDDVDLAIGMFPAHMGPHV